MSYTVGEQIGINAANSVVGGLIGLASAKAQHGYNKELASYQNDINIQNWRMQNEYNTPTAQRERLEQAGLNPALMYGNGATSTANGGNIPAYQQAGVDISSNMLNAMQMMQLASNIRKTDAETKNIGEDTKGKEIGNITLGARLQADLDKAISETRVNSAEVDFKIKQMSKIDAEIGQIDMNVRVMREEINLKIAETDSIKEKTKLTKLQQTTEILNQLLTEANTRLIGAKTDTEKAMLGNVRADTDLKVAQTVNQYSQANQADSSSHLLNAQSLMQEYKNLYYREYGVFPDANEQMFAMNLITTTSEGEDIGKVKMNYFGDKALGHAERIGDVFARNRTAKAYLENTKPPKKGKPIGFDINYNTNSTEGEAKKYVLKKAWQVAKSWITKKK